MTAPKPKARKADIAAMRAKEFADPKAYYFHPSYEQIVGDFGCEVVDSETLGSYQGDILFLLRDGKQFGLLVVGYGSCSGCDSLEAAGEDVVEIQSLADELFNGIHWEPTAKKMVEYLKTRDAAKDFWYCGGETALDRFIEKLSGS